MSFPGKFTEHFLPEHFSRVSLSFLVDTMDKRRGGCAPNIAYTLALLGERPLLMGTAGQDFPEYAPLARSRRRRYVARAGSARQVHGVVLLQHRHGQQSDRVLLRRRHGPRRRTVVPHVAGRRPRHHLAQRAGGHDAVRRRSAGRWASRYIFDPGQQCARMSGAELADGIAGADMVICNDYEFELIRQKTSLDEDAILAAGARRSSSRAASTGPRFSGPDSGPTYRRSSRTRSWTRRASATRTGAAS